jgi:hypothetical protein
LLRHRTLRKPSKPVIAIAAAGIGFAAAASSALALTFPGGAPVGAATAADYVSAATQHASTATANTVTASRTAEQVQAFKAKVAWNDQLAAVARAQHIAAKRRAARKAAAARAAAHRATVRAARRAAARRAASRKQAAKSARRSPAQPPAQPSGSPQKIAMAMLSSFGWSSSQFSCLDPLWSRESGWNVAASNPDGAYGIPQAMPGSKMASAGPGWQTNAATQIRWGLGYIKGLYGSPCGAWSHEQSTGWY